MASELTTLEVAMIVVPFTAIGVGFGLWISWSLDRCVAKLADFLEARRG